MGTYLRQQMKELVLEAFFIMSFYISSIGATFATSILFKESCEQLCSTSFICNLFPMLVLGSKVLIENV